MTLIPNTPSGIILPMVCALRESLLLRFDSRPEKKIEYRSYVRPVSSYYCFRFDLYGKKSYPGRRCGFYTLWVAVSYSSAFLQTLPYIISISQNSNHKNWRELQTLDECFIEPGKTKRGQMQAYTIERKRGPPRAFGEPGYLFQGNKGTTLV